MSQIPLINTENVNDIRIRGELILDATGNPWPNDFLAFHWINDDNDGLLTTMRRQEEDISRAVSTGWRIPNEGTYSPLIR
jgi:hypothetical protein